MNDIAKLLGSKIRVLRASLGISQEELAFKAGISAAHLGQIERAVKKPNIDTVAKIAAALGISLSVLFNFMDTADNTEESVILNKINAQLSSMTESQQKDVLKIIKVLKHSHE